MTKEELATERNEVREILEGFSEELSQSNLDKLSRVFCIINGDEKRITELEAQIEKMKRCIICKHYSCISGCSYHSNWAKDCKENGMKLFELKE